MINAGLEQMKAITRLSAIFRQKKKNFPNLPDFNLLSKVSTILKIFYDESNKV